MSAPEPDVDAAIDKFAATANRIADERNALLAAARLAERAIFMVINNRPENENGNAPTNMGLVAVLDSIRAAIARATGAAL